MNDDQVDVPKCPNCGREMVPDGPVMRGQANDKVITRRYICRVHPHQWDLLDIETGRSLRQ
jgi:hypothetical protein